MWWVIPSGRSPGGLQQILPGECATASFVEKTDGKTKRFVASQL